MTASEAAMGLILGLDVSTSCVGVCLLRDDVGPQPDGSHILLLDRIEFKKCKTVWQKADHVSAELTRIRKGGAWATRVCIEEALMSFRPGMSSAQTISSLLRFNGVVSYIARDVFGVDPEYIASNHARKVCGIKLQRTALGGPQKEQVFSHMVNNDLKHVVWPKTKTGKVVPWSRDATDAFVIARAAYLNVPIVMKPKKPKKSPKPLGGCAYPCDPPCSGKLLKGLTMCRKHQPFPA
jgi:hypothetical protein